MPRRGGGTAGKPDATGAGKRRERFSFTGLRARSLLLVLLAVLPALALTLLSGLERRRVDLARVRENAMQLAQIAAFTQSQLMESTRQLLIALAGLPEVRGGDPAACSALLADLLTQYPRYTNFGAAGTDGVIFCSAVPTEGAVTIADRTYFRRALGTRAFAVGEYQIGRVTGRATVGVGYPVLDGTGEVRSVVFAGLDLAWLNRLAADAGFPAETTLTVVDRTGTVLVRSPDQERWVGRPVSGSPFFEGLLAGQGSGTAERLDLDGTPRLFAYTRLGDAAQGTDVYAGVGIARALAVAEADVTLWRNLTLLALVGSLALLAAWVGGELFFLRPVRALVQATRRVSAGDLSARARLGPGAGELGQLSRSFDEMATSLQQAERQRAVQEELRRQYSVLEAELAQAARVQAELLPRGCPTLPGFDLAARCIPAREVGGDFYDWQESPPGVLSLTLADVMGKGMAAALLMATVRAALRAGAHDSPPAVAIQSAATALESDLESSGSFVTLFHARLEVEPRRLCYVDAGHGHAFLLRGDGGVDELRPRGLPLGVLPGESYQEGTVTLCPGDALVVYSDGLVEACPDLGTDRAAVAGRLERAMGAAEMVDRLVALARAGGPPPDDLTVVVLRCVG